MDLSNTTGADIVRMIDGTEYRFVRLRMGHLGELLETLRAQKRARLEKTLEQSNVSDDAKLDRMIAFDEQPLGTIDGLRWSWTPAGAAQTVLRSLKISNDKASLKDVDALPLTPDEVVALAVELWGYRVKLKTEDGDIATSGGDSSDPLTSKAGTASTTGASPPA